MKIEARSTKHEARNGYSLVEMIVYVAILSVVTIVIANTLVSFSRNYRNLLVLRLVDHSAIDAMERIARDIRGATSIDTGNSTFGSSPGVLTLVATSGSVSTTTKFYLQNGIVKVDVNGAYSGPLTLSGTSITTLVFRRLTGGSANAVKIDMTISAAVGTVTEVKSYHSTVNVRAL